MNSALPLFDPSAAEIRAGIERDVQRLATLPPPSRYDRDDITSSRHRGNEESEAAHEGVRDSKESVRRMILSYLRLRRGLGATCEEVAVAVGLRYTTASARLSELKAEAPPRVVASSLTRKTTAGSAARVLVLAGEKA